eukprot:1140081-Prymnesium_polylepis.2
MVERDAQRASPRLQHTKGPNDIVRVAVQIVEILHLAGSESPIKYVKVPCANTHIWRTRARSRSHNARTH